MTFRAPILNSLSARASNDPQRMRARRIEAKIIAMMPARAWLSSTAVSRLIGAADERKTRARLDRLVNFGEIERKREQGNHGLVYLYRRPARPTNVAPRGSAQLRTLISDLRQGVCNLEIGIKTIENRALFQDVITRRDNLLATISTLETLLDDLGC